MKDKGLCIDISNNNGTLTAGDFRGVPVRMLIVKATEGLSFHDSLYTRNRVIAKALNVPFGAYHFIHADESGSAQADYFLKYAHLRVGDIQPFLDAEDTRLGIERLAMITTTAATHLKARGYHPIVYASSSVWLQMIKYRPGLRQFPVWEAQYPGNYSRWFPFLHRLRFRLRHGATVVLWQWTQSYSVGRHRFDASRIFVPIPSITIKGNQK